MDNSTLTAEEQAYFDTRGETAPPVVEKEPAPAPEATEEIEAADVADDIGADDDADDVEEQRTVSHRAFHAEREKRKALERELQEHKEFRIRLEERQKYLAELDAKAATPAPEPEVVPDPDEDVFAASKYALTKTQELEKRLEEQARIQREEAQRVQVARRMEAAEVEFRSATPDYDDAMKHLIANRHAELEAFGYDPARRAAIVQQEALQIIAAAERQRQNPAKFAYDLALKRGWQPKPQAVVEGEDGEERTERAKVASRSLSSVGGAPSGQMTAERLLKMSATEFAAYERKNPATVRRLMSM